MPAKRRHCPVSVETAGCSPPSTASAACSPAPQQPPSTIRPDARPRTCSRENARPWKNALRTASERSTFASCPRRRDLRVRTTRHLVLNPGGRLPSREGGGHGLAQQGNVG